MDAHTTFYIFYNIILYVLGKLFLDNIRLDFPRVAPRGCSGAGGWRASFAAMMIFPILKPWGGAHAWGLHTQEDPATIARMCERARQRLKTKTTRRKKKQCLARNQARSDTWPRARVCLRLCGGAYRWPTDGQVSPPSPPPHKCPRLAYSHYTIAPGPRGRHWSTDRPPRPRLIGFPGPVARPIISPPRPRASNIIK